MRFNILLLISFVGFIHCVTERNNQQFVHVTDDDFQQEDIGNPDISEGMQLDLWAPGPLLRNAVSLTFDRQGVAYVSETSRRKSSDIDIRNHPDWMTESLGLSTLEQTAAFHRKKLDPALSAQNSWLEDFDKNGIHDFNDLMVQSERVRKIVDMDNDGRADVSSVYAEAFRSMLTGVAAGIMAHDGGIYLSVAPDLWELRDLDGDGVMDNKHSISYGYGIHIAYAGHDMSGITIGPDGRLYWSIGDMGVNTVDQNGKHWVYPHEGAIMRCNPDGSDFEVFAHGLRNPQELAFNKYGDLFTIDNDGDHPGEHERYVHVIEGSDSGWRIYWQYGKYHLPHESYKVWIDERLHEPHFEGQAAYIIPPIDLAPNGPCGLVYNPGPGWGGNFEEAFMATFFTGSSANSKVEAFWMDRNQSSYKLSKTHQLVGGIVPTGLEFGPDGALYVIDWKDGYEKKPSGRIWRITPENQSLQNQQGSIRQIIQSDWTGKSEYELSQFLDHPDMRIRQLAQFELVSRNASKTFEDVIATSEAELPIIHAIWGLGQLGRTRGYDCSRLVLPLKEDRVTIRAQAAKVLGELKINQALDDLLICLEDTSAYVVRHAVEAIGKIGEARAFEALILYLVDHPGIDPYLRHTFSLAICRLNQAERLCGTLFNHHSNLVRMVAVLCLRQLKSPLITGFMNDPDPLILDEVARSIHDDESISGAMTALAECISNPKTSSQVYIRRSINANLRLGDDASIRRLCAFAANPDHLDMMRKEAILSLSYWDDPPILDRVEGRYRIPSAKRDMVSEEQVLNLLLDGTIRINPELWSLVIRCIGTLKLHSLEQELVDILAQKDLAEEIYVQGLESLARLNSEFLPEIFKRLLNREGQHVQTEILHLLENTNFEDSLRIEIIQLCLDSKNIPAQQQGILQLAGIKAGQKRLKEYVWDLVNQRLDTVLMLEVLEAAKQTDDPQIKDLIRRYFSAVDTMITANKYIGVLRGGNQESGRNIFLNNPGMPCTQCHSLDGKGGLVGPDLSNIGNRLSRRQLLESLIEPSKRIAPGYGMVSVNRTDGSQISGVLEEEDENIIRIKTGEDQVISISQTDVVKTLRTPSAMISAEGFLDAYSIRDLISFLTSLKEPEN